MNTKKLLLGIFLLLSFAVVLLIIFMPIFGNGRNGLQFSDDFFNSLAKGSSNFMENMRHEVAQPQAGAAFAVDISLDNPEQAKMAEALFTKAGAQVEAAGQKLKISGDLGKVLLQVISDSEVAFNNQGEKLQAAYNFSARDALRTWWFSLKKVADALTKQKAFKQARAINEIQERALEPAFNFSGIAPKKVSENIALLTFMLVFYVIYTLWYGYGIFMVCEGIGLGMVKGAKKEV
jgi:hypothetical protein